MHVGWMGSTGMLAQGEGLVEMLGGAYLVLKVLVGFSLIIVVHELGHFLACRWQGVRVDRFAIGFFYRVCGWRRGEGFTFGKRPSYTAAELAAKGWGETDYCLNALPFGGYVKMLGEDDIIINEKTGEMKTSDDPRAFPNKPVWRRMIVVSGGVVFNAVFAVLLYIVVFLLLGKNMVSPQLGFVDPGSPAANAGLLPGDRIISVDGETINSFEDIGVAWALGGDTLHLRVERAGHPLDHELLMHIGEVRGEREKPGFMQVLTTTVADTDPSLVRGESILQPKDRITKVDGRPVSTLADILTAYSLCHGRTLELTVERRDPNAPGGKRTVQLMQAPWLTVEPASDQGTEAEIKDSQTLLGLRRRWMAAYIPSGTPAKAAGFQEGDVIAQWDNIPNPNYVEITSNIQSHENEPISVVVERPDGQHTLIVTPRRDTSLIDSTVPKVGISFEGEQIRTVVADVAPGTPAAALGIPRGSVITDVGGKAVHNWFEVYEALRAAAGTTAEVRWRSGSAESAGQMAVPGSVVNELGLAPTAVILRIDGQESVTLSSGKSVSLPAAAAVKELLGKYVGQTVTVEYAAGPGDLSLQTRDFAVRAESRDPWQMRVRYSFNALRFEQKTELVSAHGNPIVALTMGVKYTGRELWKMYRALETILTKKSGTQHVAGPVGIFRFAVQQAESGLSDLLFFLAFLSINLAVLNFMPLPVVDGGLMVFLILEKIRGKPLGLKTQVITTLSGLALIVLCFLFVTLQDIIKWWHGGL